MTYFECHWVLFALGVYKVSLLLSFLCNKNYVLVYHLHNISLLPFVLSKAPVALFWSNGNVAVWCFPESTIRLSYSPYLYPSTSFLLLGCTSSCKILSPECSLEVLCGLSHHICHGLSSKSSFLLGLGMPILVSQPCIFLKKDLACFHLCYLLCVESAPVRFLWPCC